MAEETNKFDQWCIIELMGHQRMAGRVTTESIGGASFLRIDVPEVTREIPNYFTSPKTVQAYTRYLSSAAVYAINPCTEEVARAAAASMMVSAPSLLEFKPQPTLGAGNDPNDPGDLDDETEYQ